MCAKKSKGDDLGKKGLDSKRDGSGYEKNVFNNKFIV